MLRLGGREGYPRISPILWTTPALALIAFLFAGGLIVAAAQSVGYFEPTGESAFTLTHYRAVISGTEFLPSLLLTLWVSAASTVLSAAFAVTIALAVRRSSESGLLPTLLQIPIAIPHLAIAIATIHLIAPGGLIARLSFALGLIDNPAGFPQLLNDRFGIGIIFVYVLKETPFLAVLCLAVLVRIESEYSSLARTLGATPRQRLRYVTLPLLAPALGAGSLVVFAFIFSAFEVPYLLGRPYPAMLGVVAQRKFLSSDLADRPEAIAVAIIAAGTAVLAATAAFHVHNRLSAQ